LSPLAVSSLSRRPPSPTPFPYTTLFRSRHRALLERRQGGRAAVQALHGLRQASLLPARAVPLLHGRHRMGGRQRQRHHLQRQREDRKSTRLNSSHVKISYAVFCLKKKNN